MGLFTRPGFAATVPRAKPPGPSRPATPRSAGRARWSPVIEQDDAGLVSVAQKHTLADAIDRYRREILPTLNPSTIPNYTRHLTYWENALGHLRLSDVTAARIASLPG